MANCDYNSTMGFAFGLENPNPKRKHRWLFKLDGVSAEGVKALPPRRAARPSVSFKEQEVQHLTETIWFPVKPEWKTFNLTLYDIRCGQDNPVFNWLVDHYDPESGGWQPVVAAGLKRSATLELYDGNRHVLETWRFENCYPQVIEWGDLDMDNQDVVTADLVIRYDRAYLPA